MAIRPRSYKYATSVRWTGEKKGALTVAGKPPVVVATPPGFQGHGGIWSPGDLYVAAVNSCIMATFLVFSVRAGMAFEGYESEAGEIPHKAEKNRLVSNSLRTEVVLEPAIG